VRWSDQYPAFVFAIIFAAIFLAHVPLLSLPYFWDEAGYYVPAARDILLTGSFIPHSTVSNAHPPLVMVWLALWWKVFGYAPLVTRTAMLMLSAFSLLGIFRLAEGVTNTSVAVSSAVCVGFYPVFFAQSSLAHVDLAAAGFIFWGLAAYLQKRSVATFVWFSLAALAKETAILAPLALAAWEIAGFFVSADWRREFWMESTHGSSYSNAKINSRRVISLLLPVLPLGAWYGYHFAKTGYVFGNPEFFRYNIAATLNPIRFLLALAMRIWQVSGYLHLWILTGAMLLAMLFLAPRLDGTTGQRPRIGLPVQMAFYVVILAYVLSMALIGGAVLARYMLPVVPLVIIVSISTLWRRVPGWPFAVVFVAFAFIAGWFWNPPYGFSPEDNLAYRDYIVLHEDAERFLEARYPMARVLTAWPASDELTRPWLGYLTRPLRVVRIEDFSFDEIFSAADVGSNFEAALIFSTKYEPAPTRWDRWQAWTELKSRFFGFHRDLPPAVAAQILGGRVTFSEQRRGQWVAVIELNHEEMQNAALRKPGRR
jgi:Dolichyl-phosphate-mannose-protein mannosyltransferase